MLQHNFLSIQLFHQAYLGSLNENLEILDVSQIEKTAIGSPISLNQANQPHPLWIRFHYLSPIGILFPQWLELPGQELSAEYDDLVNLKQDQLVKNLCKVWLFLV